LKKENEALNTLYSIGLLVDPQIEIIYKNGEKYSLEDSSSGEMNLITSLIGIIASFKQNSLLFIDEPEISLHPNWQMRYISLIKELFSNEIFNSSHIVIATHSHFLVSDLDGESSKIIGLTNSNGLKTVEFGDKLNTFGWSAEDVLFRVFNVTSSRNHYFEMAIAELLDLLYVKSNKTDRINEILIELKRLKISKDDPLNELIEETEDYLKYGKSNN
jgi:predicted ATP-binding protein involved in virulence